jgi:hypothetical protein
MGVAGAAGAHADNPTSSATTHPVRAKRRDKAKTLQSSEKIGLIIASMGGVGKPRGGWQAAAGVLCW